MYYRMSPLSSNDESEETDLDFVHDDPEPESPHMGNINTSKTIFNSEICFHNFSIN